MKACVEGCRGSLLEHRSFTCSASGDAVEGQACPMCMYSVCSVWFMFDICSLFLFPSLSLLQGSRIRQHVSVEVQRERRYERVVLEMEMEIEREVITGFVSDGVRLMSVQVEGRHSAHVDIETII